MRHPLTWLSETQLLALVRDRGFPVSRDQLRRWQKRRLAPRGVKHGLGRGLGTAVRYPPEAAVALKFLAEAVSLYPRRLDRAGWLLWVFGLPVSEFITESLTRYLTRVRRRDRRLLRFWHEDASGVRDRYLVSRQVLQMRRRAAKHGIRPAEADAILHVMKLEESYTPRADLAETEVEVLAQAVGRRMRSPVNPVEFRVLLNAWLNTNASKDTDAEVRRWLLGSPGELLDHWRNDAMALWVTIGAAKHEPPRVMPVEFFLSMLRARVEDRKLHRGLARLAHEPFWERLRKNAFAEASGEEHTRTMSILRPLFESPLKPAQKVPNRRSQV